MNIILLFKEDFISDNLVRLNAEDRRVRHIKKILKSKEGDELNIGLLNDRLGYGTIVTLNEKYLEMTVALERQSPSGLPVTLLLAMPRPIVLKRLLATVTALGVKKIYLFNSERVEKSFWNSSLLEPKEITEALMLGLEQAKDTILPQVEIRHDFSLFTKKELPEMIKNKFALVAHPGCNTPCPSGITGDTVLAIGPEGGFIDDEIITFDECGFQPVDLGPRILRVETVVPVLLAKIFN